MVLRKLTVTHKHTHTMKTTKTEKHDWVPFLKQVVKPLLARRWNAVAYCCLRERFACASGGVESAWGRFRINVMKGMVTRGELELSEVVAGRAVVTDCGAATYFAVPSSQVLLHGDSEWPIPTFNSMAEASQVARQEAEREAIHSLRRYGDFVFLLWTVAEMFRARRLSRVSR